jgi:NAD(P)-dependent dehydrogenase (short-subunit alcohol dehydrogenase family)
MGGAVWPIEIDAINVTDPLHLLKWLDGFEVDALVTCAGVSCVKSTVNLTPNEWKHVIDVNLTGTLLSIIHARLSGATRIVTIGSIHGCTPTSYPQRAAYTASKGGVKALTEALAVEFAPQGVAVNCVAPGHLPALMDGTGAGQELLDAARARTPTGKLTTPEEVAEVIFWLCDSAPLSLTGNTLVVDGGFTLNTWPMK